MKGMAFFSKIIFILYAQFLVSCGTPAVIMATNCQHKIDFVPMKEFKTPDFEASRTSLSFFGSSLGDQLAISPCELLMAIDAESEGAVETAEEMVTEDSGEEEIRVAHEKAFAELEIITSYTLQDVLLNFIPFYGSRTVVIRGNFEHHNPLEIKKAPKVSPGVQ